MKLHRKFEINSPNHNEKKGWKTKEAILSDKPREKLYSPPVSPVGGLINDYIIYFFLAINMRDIIGHFCKTQPKFVLYFIYTYFYTSPWSERN